MPSVYQTERPFSNLASGPKIGVHFSQSERKDGEASEHGDGFPRFLAAAKEPQSHRENGVRSL